MVAYRAVLPQGQRNLISQLFCRRDLLEVGSAGFGLGGALED